MAVFMVRAGLHWSFKISFIALVDDIYCEVGNDRMLVD